MRELPGRPYPWNSENDATNVAMVTAPHLLLLLISSTHAAAVNAPLAGPEAPKEGAPQPAGAPWLRLLLQTVLR